MSAAAEQPKVYVPETVTHYLARAWSAGNDVVWDEEVQAFRREVQYRFDDEDCTEEKIRKSAKRLPIIVPGLEVVKTELRKSKRWKDRGYVWFTWSPESEDARFQELFEKHGVADERLEYVTCSGKLNVEKEDQLALPGTVTPEPRATDGLYATGSIGKYIGIYAAYTGHGLSLIDGGFAQRICHPNRGGLGAEWFSHRRVVVGNEWWLAGTRGDSDEILSLEIQASPLSDETKTNLLENLKAMGPRDTSVRVPRY